MINPRKDKASDQAGLCVAGREAKATEQSKIFKCNAEHISNVCRELADNGLALRSTTGDSQLTTLPKVLQYLGSRGLSTYEGTAAGYLRIATRIKELKDTWEIHSLREDVVGPDGLLHKGVARYVLIGRRKNPLLSQLSLELEAQV